MDDFTGIKFHIAGSANKNISIEMLKITHIFIKKLVADILSKNGKLVITFGSEDSFHDLPLSFDWTIIEAIKEYIESFSKNEIAKIVTRIHLILYYGFYTKIPDSRNTLFNDIKEMTFGKHIILPRLEKVLEVIFAKY